ncbi:hypothetical protein NDU88_010166 [Pleurodeles waltl]|uniref:Uncharacterized protein n=1 Tax=Pleurodeles waltl TaxID=8319 RepID=A0AAV7PV56_PLEWA|nr:hypothetical protein NDU88_010166 [Pleurodeles waltl]
MEKVENKTIENPDTQRKGNASRAREVRCAAQTTLELAVPNSPVSRRTSTSDDPDTPAARDTCIFCDDQSQKLPLKLCCSVILFYFSSWTGMIVCLERQSISSLVTFYPFSTTVQNVCFPLLRLLLAVLALVDLKLHVFAQTRLETLRKKRSGTLERAKERPLVDPTGIELLIALGLKSLPRV